MISNRSVGDVVVSDRSLSELLDGIGRVETRAAKMLVLRRWIDELMRERDEERAEERVERLGKLGGG